MSVTLWRFTDGKPGHDVQSAGLARALSKATELAVCDIPVQGGARGFGWWLSGRYPPAAQLPVPDLLLGAGHATHSHLLAARRSRGGRIILLMKPSLPLRCFDLCLIPEHDAPPQAANVLPTLGALNDIETGPARDTGMGLIILGGPSRHFRWDDDEVLAQVERLLDARPMRRWLLTTSRRTPPALTQRLARSQRFEYRPFAATDRAWLKREFAQAAEVWTSEDSISMIYEALTAGARLGLLKVRRGSANRVTAAVDALVDRGWVGRPGDWQPRAPDRPINEAARCADWIRQTWLTDR